MKRHKYRVVKLLIFIFVALRMYTYISIPCQMQNNTCLGIKGYDAGAWVLGGEEERQGQAYQ